MEVFEDIVIVGAGIAGLTTSLGLHRLGIRSLVLESSDGLRATGFAFSTWGNAWKALDAIGIGDSLRRQHHQLHGVVAASPIPGHPPSEISFKVEGTQEHEVRCVKRKLLLEALERELPSGTIRFSSKVVSIEDSGFYKVVHLADGTTLKTKVLIGCDGVNSVVAKYMGFKKPAFVGRSGIRAYAQFSESHGFSPNFLQFFGKGFRAGFLPCDDKTVYWFFTFSPSTQDKDLEENPDKMKQIVLSKLTNVPDQVRDVIERTELDNILLSPLRFRHPWELLWRKISKGNVCVIGDALHPMTPDIGQGGCSALEDGVVLARFLAKAILNKPSGESTEKANEDEEKYKRIKKGLNEFSEKRKWRSIDLISTAYMVGFITQSDGKIMNFMRDKILAGFLAGMLLKKSSFDCGKLNVS